MTRRQSNLGRRRKARAGLDELARDLRIEMSLAERNLWQALRGRRFEGLKFRRQHPIGRHIADFACLEKFVVIELDGESHDSTAEQDANRTGLIGSLRFRVIRFKNEDVLFNLDGVLKEIFDCCVRRAATPSPQPSPPGTVERELEDRSP